MFNRFTERARRSIFFARYEASRLGTSEITSEELLLGILREDKAVALLLGLDNVESVRKEIESLHPSRQVISTSVDLPLSKECQRVLACAVEEADALHHQSVGPPHLVLGLLRAEESLAVQLLSKRGVDYQRYRTLVEQESLEAVPKPIERSEEQASPFRKGIEAFQFFLENTVSQLRVHPPTAHKAALAASIERAMVHQQCFAQALVESRPVADAYRPQDIAAAHYHEYPWREAVSLWVSLNQLNVHLLAQIPHEKAELLCRIGNAQPVPLSKMVEDYIERCQDSVLPRAPLQARHPQVVSTSADWNDPQIPATPVFPVAAVSLEPAVRALDNLLEVVPQYLDMSSGPYADRPLKRRPWTRKQAFGHLIDWAIAHQRWIAQAVVESKLAVSAYPPEDAAPVAHYVEFPWQDTLDLWLSMNRLLIHTLRRVPEDQVKVRCRIGIAAPVTLAHLVSAYVAHCDDIAGQVLALLR